jgi:hypothetical protein
MEIFISVYLSYEEINKNFLRRKSLCGIKQKITGQSAFFA